MKPFPYTHGNIDDEKLYNPSIRPHQERQTISPGIRRNVFERDDWTCQECGASTKNDKKVPLAVDDKIPVSRRQRMNIPSSLELNEIENLQTLCVPCNTAKSDQYPNSYDGENKVV